MIDAIVLIVIVAVLNAIGIIDTGISEEAEVSTTDGLIQAVIVVAYYVVLTVAFGGTLGKMALGMRVVDRDGNRAGLGPVLIREVIARALGTILAAILGSFIGGFVGAARRRHHHHHDPVRREAAGLARQDRRNVRGEGEVERARSVRRRKPHRKLGLGATAWTTHAGHRDSQPG